VISSLKADVNSRCKWDLNVYQGFKESLSLSEHWLKREVGFSLLIICRAWRHLLCLTQSFTTTNFWQIITESCWNFMWPQTPSRHFCLLDFFLFECLGATLWHICPDCCSAGVLVVSTSVVFRSWGLNVAGRRGWTLLSPIQQSKEICWTLFTERERERERERALCSFLCLLKVHLFEEMREWSGFIQRDQSVCHQPTLHEGFFFSFFFFFCECGSVLHSLWTPDIPFH